MTRSEELIEITRYRIGLLERVSDAFHNRQSGRMRTALQAVQASLDEYRDSIPAGIRQHLAEVTKHGLGEE